MPPYNSKDKRNKGPKEEGNMVYVRPANNPKDAFLNLEIALRRFRKKLEDSGVLEDFYKHTFYIKPSARKRLPKKSKKVTFRSAK